MAAKGYRQLGVEAAARLGVWPMGNLEWVAAHTAEEVAERVRQDLNLQHVKAGMVRDLCAKLGVELKSARGNQHTKGVDRTHIVAVAVRDLYEHLKLPVPPLLLAVVKRQPPKPEEN